MDLRAEVDRLRLDQLAFEVCQVLANTGVPHALLKGPSTANWLYDPPRRYIDVDILVPLSRIHDAVRALDAAGVARAIAGGVGEEAQHSLLMHSTHGYEVDVHVSLPSVPPTGDRPWQALAPHVEPLKLDGVGTVPALDEAGRCLVIALHALGAPDGSQRMEDLRRARDAVSAASWQSAALLAEELQVADLFAGSIAQLDGASALSPRAYLLTSGAPSAALAWQRLADARMHELPRMLWRELVPTRGFMLHAYPVAREQRFGLLRAHLRRWRSIARQLPAAFRAVRESRRLAS